MKNRRNILALAMAMIFLFPVTSHAAYRDDIIILYTNDTHCGIEEKFKSHRMRHTVLTLLNNSRLADDKSLQAWAGHRDAAFTRRQYMTPQEEQLQTVGNGFSEYISSLL